MTLSEYVREVVRLQPEPPRRVSIGSLVIHNYRSRGGLAMLGVSGLLGLPTSIVTLLFLSGPAWQRYALGIAFALFTAFLAAVPAFGAVRLRRPLARGIVVTAEISTVEWSPPTFRPATIDAGTHGIAHGTRQVRHPAGSFSEAFESDAAWASELVAGALIGVLADPETPQVLLELGPSPRPR